MKGFTAVRVQPEDRLAITGAGTNRLLTVFNLKAREMHHIHLDWRLAGRLVLK